MLSFGQQIKQRLPATLVVIALALSLVVSIPFAQKALAFSGGTGTSENPFQISTCSQLSGINAGLDAFYELAGNIDCSGIDPGRIGSQSAPFTGTFRGNGHTIANITVVTSDDNMGLFGYTSNAKIYNVVLDNIFIGGANNVGALIGYTYYTTVAYVSVINSSITGTGQYTGGIVGYLGGSSITKSYVDETTVSGNDRVGGLTGVAIGPSTVTESYIQGVVDGATYVGGVTGQAGAGPVIIQNNYADVVFNDAGSDIAGSEEFGATVSGNFMASAPYLGNSTQSPMNSWDFVTTWIVRDGDYPGLRGFPQMLCDAPISTTTTMHVACETQPGIAGDSTWNIQYAFAGSSSWVSLPDQTGAGFDATISNVLPGTDYRVRFRFTADGFTGAWGAQDILTDGNSDVDGDGVSNKDESLAPNGGDADNDAVDDYQQANVTSLYSFVSSSYVVVKTNCDNNFNTQIGLESSSDKDSAYDYPAGLVSFVGRGCGVGATVNVSVYFFGDYGSGLVVRKSKAGTYTTVPGVTLQRTTIGGNQVTIASYQVVDGGPLDQDGVADGNIVDPVGLAAAVTSTPSGSLAETGVQLISPRILVAIFITSLTLLVLIVRPGSNKSAD